MRARGCRVTRCPAWRGSWGPIWSADGPVRDAVSPGRFARCRQGAGFGVAIRRRFDFALLKASGPVGARRARSTSGERVASRSPGRRNARPQRHVSTASAPIRRRPAPIRKDRGCGEVIRRYVNEITDSGGGSTAAGASPAACSTFQALGARPGTVFGRGEADAGNASAAAHPVTTASRSTKSAVIGRWPQAGPTPAWTAEAGTPPCSACTHRVVGQATWPLCAFHSAIRVASWPAATWPNHSAAERAERQISSVLGR